MTLKTIFVFMDKKIASNLNTAGQFYVICLGSVSRIKLDIFDITLTQRAKTDDSA